MYWLRAPRHARRDRRFNRLELEEGSRNTGSPDSEKKRGLQHAGKAGKRRKRCSLRLASSAQYGEGSIARTSITSDGSTRPLAERLKPEPFCTQDNVAVLGILTERTGTNEVSKGDV